MDFIRAWYQKNILEREKFICARKDTAKMFCQWSIPHPSTSFLPLLSLMPHYFTNLSKYVNVMHDGPTSPPNIKKKKNPAKCKTELQPVPNHHTPETNSKFHILNVWKMLLWVWVPGLAPRRLEGKSFQWLPGQQELWKPLDSQGSASGVRSRHPSAGGGGTSHRKKWGTGFRSHTLRKPRSGTVHNWGQASLKSKVGSWV